MERLLLAGALCLGLAACDSGPTPQAPSATGARFACQTAVKSMLHDPSGAEWVDLPNWPVKRDGSLWSVEVMFRAKNGFGATRTAVRLCTIRVDPDATWHLVEMSELKA